MIIRPSILLLRLWTFVKGITLSLSHGQIRITPNNVKENHIPTTAGFDWYYSIYNKYLKMGSNVLTCKLFGSGPVHRYAWTLCRAQTDVDVRPFLINILWAIAWMTRHTTLYMARVAVAIAWAWNLRGKKNAAAVYGTERSLIQVIRDHGDVDIYVAALTASGIHLCIC